MVRAVLYALVLGAGSVAAAAGPFGDAVPVGDEVLGRQRGGIRLASGLDVAIGISIETRIGGQLALRTQLSDSASGVQVFTGGPASVTVAPSATAGPDVATPAPVVIADRSGTGTHVVVFPSVNVSPVSVGEGQAFTAGILLPVVEGGAGLDTAFGAVTLRREGDGQVAQLSGNGIDVRQFIGAATGVIVANTVDNRVIDTTTTVHVDLSGAIVPANFTSALEGVSRAVGSRIAF